MRSPVLVFTLIASFAHAQTAPKSISLPTSKTLSVPTPGWIAPLNGFTPTIALSPDHRYAALLNDGYGTQEQQARQSISVFDLNANKLTTFPDDRFAEEAHQSYFVGLAFSSDGKHLYASVGSITDPAGEEPNDTGNGIAVYSFQDGTMTPERFIKVPPQKLAAGKRVPFGLKKTALGTAISYPAGLTLAGQTSQGADRILVAENFSDSALLLDSASGQVLQAFDFSNDNVVPSAYPHSVIVSRKGKRAWCSLWNASSVAELDLDNGKVVRRISLLAPKDKAAPGSHPTALALSADEKTLFVALSNADKVAAVSTESGKIIRLLDTRLSDSQFAGTTPASVALSEDGKHLFAAESSLDAVAVFDLASQSNQAKGFIPTEWYPTAVAVVGGDLLIASSKGQGTGPDNGHDTITGGTRHREHPYIPTLLYGSLARIPINTIAENLSAWTDTVEKSNLVKDEPNDLFASRTNPIKHVIYIIKENRTYDQVLGDLDIGNRDPSLTMYGESVTPNLHKLARQFGVLDNFYDSGEVSGDGHEWSTAAITTDYNENTWQIAYRGRERTYDYQGTVAEELPAEQDRPDVDAPESGYIWDNIARHGLTYRDYGEFVSAVWCLPEKAATPEEGTPSPLKDRCPRAEVKRGEALPEGGESPWPWAIPLFSRVRPSRAVLRDHFDPKFPDFGIDYPDQVRADEFLREFKEFVQARKDGKPGLPQFITLYLPDDHTGGTRPGKPRPAASVADNDLAVGRVVDAVSHSPYWGDSAIMILEDDAQNGADHVDAHRSIAFVISKYSPGSAAHPAVDSHFYTTVNMIHTIEALLGMPPMNQNDGYAPLMSNMFSGSGDQPPFTVDFSNRDNGLIYQANEKKAAGAKQSIKMDFSRPDANNAEVLNAILWRDQKGSAPMPVPQHNIIPDEKKNDDD